MKLLLERAGVLLARREIAESSRLLDDLECLDAELDECSSLRWMAGMLTGDFAAAWRASDRIRGRGNSDSHRFWNGTPLEGKRVIVRCLHGLGDTVQMLRYAPLLAEQAAEVVYEVAPSMTQLSLQFRGVRHVITWGHDAPVEPPAWDLQLEVMELPYIFRTEAHQLPIANSYLRVSSSGRTMAALSMGAGYRPRVGLVWAGGEWNGERSLPFGMLKPLLNIAEIEFWNLQDGTAGKEEAGSVLRNGASICGDGLEALSATIANMSLIITVDTLAAHMAGAMGKPVWVMLQHAADWRWMMDRSDSPWYPTMRIFRQHRPGDWASVIDQIHTELRVRFSPYGNR